MLKVNIHPIKFPSDATFDYRIWTLDPVPNSPKIREKIESYLWKKALKTPVHHTYINDEFVYLVADIDKDEPVEYVGEGERKYMILPLETVNSIKLNDTPTDNIQQLVCVTLQRLFANQLNEDRSLFRGYQNYEYFLTKPDQPTSGQRSSSNVDIFRGFTFRVIYSRDYGYCLVIDVKTSYIGSKTLLDMINNDAKSQSWKNNKITRWMYDYGHVKQSVYLLDVLSTTIGETVHRNGQSTYDYLLEHRPYLKAKIDPGDRAANIAYKRSDIDDEEKHYYAATSLLKPRYTIGNKLVRRLRDTPAFQPDKRVFRIEGLITHFEPTKYKGQYITFASAVKIKNNIFDLPVLVFENAENPKELAPKQPMRFRDRQNWGPDKMDMLRKTGPLLTKEFNNPFLVYPVNLEEHDLIDNFLEKTKQVCKDYGNVDFHPQMPSYRDSAHAQDIINKVKGLVEQQDADFVLLALPRDTKVASEVYSGVKSLSVPSKCFSSEALLRAHKNNRLEQYVLGNTLPLLIESGARLWGLRDQLHYDLHIGLDVAQTAQGGLMGATTIGGRNATDVRFFEEIIPTKEKIPHQKIRDFVFNRLSEFYAQYEKLPRKILFQRDGRYYDEELIAIEDAFKELTKTVTQARDCHWAAVTIEKTSSVPVRLFRLSRDRIYRPVSGSHIAIDDATGFLITASDGLTQGTPKPLKITIKKWSTPEMPDLLEIMRDIFWLSQLNWRSPKLDISLPITIRHTDRKLEKYVQEHKSYSYE